MRNILIIIFLLSTSLFANELDKVSIQLKWKYQFQFAGFLIAKEKGFYKDLGLDVKIKEYSDKTYTLSDMKDNKTQFAVIDSALILKSIQNEPVTAMLGIYQTSPYVLMSLKSSNIRNIQDLNNKKIAIYDDENGLAIKAMLRAHNISYKQISIKDKLKKLKNKEIDVAISYISNEPFVAKEMGMNISYINPADYGFERYGDILFTTKEMLKSKPEIVNKMYQATKKGFLYAFANIDETVNLIYDKYNTQNKSKKALYYEAKTLYKLTQIKEKKFGSLNIDKIKSIAYIYSFTDVGKYNLDALNDFIFKPKEIDIELSDEEKIYIKNKKEITVCLRASYEPFMIKEKKRYSGITIDFLDEISKQTSLKINYIMNNNVSDYFKNLKNATCDAIALTVTKNNKHTFLKPTYSYVFDEIVITTSIDKPYLSDLNELGKKEVLIQKGTSSLINYVKTIYPNINLVEIEKIDLSKVASGEYYGYIHASYFLVHKILMKYPNQLKIMTKIGENKLGGSFGILKGNTLLLSIFNKSIEKISTSTKQKINGKYRTIKIEKYTDYTLFWKSFAVFFIILVVIFFSNRKLKKEILLRHDAEKKLEELNKTLEEKIEHELNKNKKQQTIMFQQSRLAQMGEIISMIAHQWRQPLNNISAMNQTIVLKYKRNKLDDNTVDKFKKDTLQQVKYMSNTIDDFRNFFKPRKNKNLFCLFNTINNSINLLKPILIQENIISEIECDNKIQLNGYENELGQVILNIINNAKDALEHTLKSEKWIKVSIKTKEKDVIISINDNAGGINDDIMENVFDPYFSTKLDRNGTGLGLYMAKVIIEEHMKGQIKIKNNEFGLLVSITLKNS